MITSAHQYIAFMESTYANRTAIRWYDEAQECIAEKAYSAYAEDIRRFAVYVADKTTGKHIAILAQNCYDYAVGLFGCILANRAAVLLNPAETEDNIRYAIELADTDLIFSDGSIEEKFPSFAESFSGITCPLSGYQTYAPMAAEDTERYEDMAIMMFTSGTTGRSKGVMISRKNLFAPLQAHLAQIELALKDHKIAAGLSSEQMNKVPAFNGLFVHRMFHAAGVATLVAYGMFGITANLCLNLRYIYQDLERMPSGRISAVPIIAEMFYKDLHRGKREKLGVLKEVSCGAAKIDEQIMNTFHENGFTISQGYALTESFCGGTLNPYTDVAKIASVGKAGEGMEIRIEDGEVCMKGDSIMMGYYNNPEETAKVLRDGWLYTGDLGYLDDDGYLYLTGRKKNLIILSGGENVSPEELEGLVSANEAVKEVVVKEKNGKICAEIFCNANKQEEIRSFITEVNRSLAMYKRMTLVEFRTEPFPRTASGKIKRI